MARVVVVGGGFGGMASAARLAKLGHEVTLVEQGPALGGALTPVEAEGYRWDGAATYTLLPGVIRDLFRKSGRPLEKEITLVELPVIREHRFTDDSTVQVHGSSRSAQLRAFDDLGPGLGRQWCDYVAAYADDWELIRREYLERPWSPELAPPELAGRLLTRETLHRRLKKTFKDERLRLVAGFPHEFGGHDLRNVPAWLGTTSYVEQALGAWTVPGGMSGLAEALTGRLATRGVTVLTGTRATDLVVRGGRVVAVSTGSADLEADVVVVAMDPRRLPALAPYVEPTMPAIPPMTTHLGLRGDVPDLGPETVLHGNPTLVVRTGGRAPDGGQAWTVHGRGQLSEDMVTTLVRYGIDVRDAVQVRVDRTPRQLVEGWAGSPEGVLWQGRATIRARLGPSTPIQGVYAAGAHATPGAGLPFVGLSAALVAQAVGPA
jgi:phytoene dehydrogenase-like protein